jgi:hypothetical protein
VIYEPQLLLDGKNSANFSNHRITANLPARYRARNLGNDVGWGIAG